MTFYRILGGHQDRRRRIEVQILRTEAVVIGKRVRYHFQPGRRELGEEALRLTDTGHGMHPLGAQFSQRTLPLRISRLALVLVCAKPRSTSARSSLVEPVMVVLSLHPKALLAIERYQI